MPKIFAVTAIILIISSYEVQESKNIYQRPDIPNLFNNQFNFDSYSQERVDKITKELSKLLNIDVNLNQKTFLNLEGNNISDFIDCGYMNDEIYVHYIERIFGTKLNIIVSFENFFEQEDLEKSTGKHKVKYIGIFSKNFKKTIQVDLNKLKGFIDNH